MIVLLPIICLFLSGVQSQKIGFGSCPEVETIQDFDPARYLGKWYEVMSYPAFFQSGQCTQALYGPVNDQGQVRVVNRQLSNGEANGIEGYAVQQRPGGGDLKVFLNTPVVGYVQGDYNVLGTDYDNFSVVYACRSVLGIKAEFSWILSRTPELSSDAQQRVDYLIARNGINTANFRKTQQDGCPDLDNMRVNLIG